MESHRRGSTSEGLAFRQVSHYPDVGDTGREKVGDHQHPRAPNDGEPSASDQQGDQNCNSIPEEVSWTTMNHGTRYRELHAAIGLKIVVTRVISTRHG